MTTCWILAGDEAGPVVDVILSQEVGNGACN